MSALRATKAGLDSTLELIAKRLRGESEEAAREQLPQRWVDLIRYLDEQPAPEAVSPPSTEEPANDNNPADPLPATGTDG